MDLMYALNAQLATYPALYRAFQALVASGEVTATRLPGQFSTPDGTLMDNFLILDDEKFRSTWAGLAGPQGSGPSPLQKLVLEGRRKRPPVNMSDERFLKLAGFTRGSLSSRRNSPG